MLKQRLFDENVANVCLTWVYKSIVEMHPHIWNIFLVQASDSRNLIFGICMEILDK